MIDIKIRRAQIEDLDRLVTLYTQLGYSIPKTEMRNRIRALIQIPSEIIYVAEKPDAPVIGLWLFPARQPKRALPVDRLPAPSCLDDLVPAHKRTLPALY